MIKSIAFISGCFLIIIKSIVAQPQLIDNFNDGDSINNFGYSWRFYTESTYPIVPTFGPGRPPAGSASSSVNQNGFTTSGAADKFATIPFTFGEEWPAGIGITGHPYICISALLAPEGSYADLSSAFGIHFKCRSHRSDLDFTLWVETDDIIKDETLAYYEKKFTTLPSWREFTFYFKDLKQPDFSYKRRPFTKNKIEKFTWFCTNMNNSGVVSDTFYLDDVSLIMTPVPVLTSPQENSINVEQPVEFKWTNIDSLQSTLIQLSTSQDFSSIAKEITVPAMTTTAVVSDLTTNTKYYWRASATNASGTSDWSPVRNFTTIPEIPSKVSLISPGNDSVNAPVAITLSWEPISAASGYTLQVSQFDDFSAVDISKTELKTAQVILPVLENRTKYYWRVRAYNVKGKGDWSETGNFTTIVSSPRIQHPVNGVKNCDTTLTLNWTAVPYALTYDLQVSKTDNFIDTLVSSTLEDTLFILNNLLNSTKYYARVRTKDTNGYSLWSDMISFSTIIRLPEKILLNQDSYNDTIKMDSVLFSWKKSIPEITRYQIELSEDSTFTNAFVDSTCTDTFKVFRHLKGENSYWWRVRALNVAGWGEYSDIRMFKVFLPVVNSAPVLLNSTSFKIYFSANKLHYKIPENCPVMYSIYNIRGMLVIQSSGKIISSGVYTINLNNIPSGTYYAVLKAGKYQYCGKVTTISKKQ